MLLDTNNAGIIFSDDIARAIEQNKKGPKSKVVRSKSLKMTVAPQEPSVKLTKSERLTGLKGRKQGKRKKFSQRAPGDQKGNIMLDGMPDYTMQPVFTITTRPMPRRRPKVCICGSVTCRKELEKMRLSQMKLTESEAKLISCVCGSSICKEESKKILNAIEKAKKLKILKKEKEKIQKEKKKIQYEKIKKNKLKKIKEMKKEKDRIKRKKESEEKKNQLKKQCDDEDAPRRKLRKEMNKRALKQVKKSKNASDKLLLAESLMDAGRIGVYGVIKFLKGTVKALRHPKDSYHDVKTTVKDPCFTVGKVTNVCDDKTIYEPAARIKHRLRSMRITKGIVKKLESYQITNYLLHSQDKNPKKRMKKFKKKRVRESFDFKCNLYMASRTKRPCLWVYYTCPWFYPQCISFLAFWRQCCHIFLFILAFIVWSPCLLCMEVFRIIIYLYCPFCIKLR